MKKALIIGMSGSGKSTFSRKLRDVTGLPLHYLDMLWHKPDKTTVSREEFDEKLAELLEKDEWIIDGNYSRTLETRLMKCDTVFLFDLPLEVCLDGVRSRIGKKREDMPWVEEEFDAEFMEWIKAFPSDNLPKIYSLLEKHRGAFDTVIFHSRREADEYIENFPR